MSQDVIELGNTLAPIAGVFLALWLITPGGLGIERRTKPPFRAGDDNEGRQRRARYGSRPSKRRSPPSHLAEWEIHE